MAMGWTNRLALGGLLVLGGCVDGTSESSGRVSGAVTLASPLPPTARACPRTLGADSYGNHYFQLAEIQLR
jgi:hypothetical protein